jgi:hypothetical protein
VESRIRRNIYILIGVAVFLLIAMIAAWYFVLIKKQKEDLASLQGQITTRQGNADRLAKALADAQKAQDRLGYLQSQIGFFRNVRYRSLKFDDINASGDAGLQKAARIATWRRWLREYFTEYGLALAKTLQDYANDAGVVINTTSKINAPPKAPEEVAVPPNGIFKPAGDAPLSVTITGPLENVIRFFDRINTSNILMMIGTIKLESAAAGGASGGPGAAAGGGANTTPVGLRPGVSPRLMASFNLTPYLLASGKDVDAAGGGGSAAPPASTAPSAPTSSGSPSSSGGP